MTLDKRGIPEKRGKGDTHGTHGIPYTAHFNSRWNGEDVSMSVGSITHYHFTGEPIGDESDFIPNIQEALVRAFKEEKREGLYRELQKNNPNVFSFIPHLVGYIEFRTGKAINHIVPALFDYCLGKEKNLAGKKEGQLYAAMRAFIEDESNKGIISGIIDKKVNEITNSKEYRAMLDGIAGEAADKNIGSEEFGDRLKTEIESEIQKYFDANFRGAFQAYGNQIDRLERHIRGFRRLTGIYRDKFMARLDDIESRLGEAGGDVDEAEMKRIVIDEMSEPMKDVFETIYAESDSRREEILNTIGEAFRLYPQMNEFKSGVVGVFESVIKDYFLNFLEDSMKIFPQTDEFEGGVVDAFNKKINGPLNERILETLRELSETLPQTDEFKEGVEAVLGNYDLLDNDEIEALMHKMRWNDARVEANRDSVARMRNAVADDRVEVAALRDEARDFQSGAQTYRNEASDERDNAEQARDAAEGFKRTAEAAAGDAVGAERGARNAATAANLSKDAAEAAATRAEAAGGGAVDPALMDDINETRRIVTEVSGRFDTLGTRLRDSFGVGGGELTAAQIAELGNKNFVREGQVERQIDARGFVTQPDLDAEDYQSGADVEGRITGRGYKVEQEIKDLADERIVFNDPMSRIWNGIIDKYNRTSRKAKAVVAAGLVFGALSVPYVVWPIGKYLWNPGKWEHLDKDKRMLHNVYDNIFEVESDMGPNPAGNARRLKIRDVPDDGSSGTERRFYVDVKGGDAPDEGKKFIISSDLAGETGQRLRMDAAEEGRAVVRVTAGSIAKR